MLFSMMRNWLFVMLWWHFRNTDMTDTLVTQTWGDVPLGTYNRHICVEIYMTEVAGPSQVIWITVLILQIRKKIGLTPSSSQPHVEYMCCLNHFHFPRDAYGHWKGHYFLHSPPMTRETVSGQEKWTQHENSEKKMKHGIKQQKQGYLGSHLDQCSLINKLQGSFCECAQRRHYMIGWDIHKMIPEIAGWYHWYPDKRKSKHIYCV